MLSCPPSDVVWGPRVLWQCGCAARALRWGHPPEDRSHRPVQLWVAWLHHHLRHLKLWPCRLSLPLASLWAHFHIHEDTVHAAHPVAAAPQVAPHCRRRCIMSLHEEHGHDPQPDERAADRTPCLQPLAKAVSAAALDCTLLRLQLFQPAPSATPELRRCVLERLGSGCQRLGCLRAPVPGAICHVPRHTVPAPQRFAEPSQRCFVGCSAN